MDRVGMAGKVPIQRSPLLKKALIDVFICLLATAMWLPTRVQAQTDSANSSSEPQAQRRDLAAEIDELRREIEEMRAELSQIAAMQRRQNEQLVREEANPPATPASAPPAPTASPIPSTAAPSATQNRRTPQQRPAAAATVPAAMAPSSDGGTATIFVFKDGNRTEAHNFAIVGGTLWIYTDQEAKKYAVSYIDVPATTAANAERGTKFQMPESR